MDFEKPPLFFVWFIPMMVAMWTASSYFTATLGGWRRLAETYQTDATIEGTTWWFRSASLGRWARYAGFLIISVNDDGLRIATLPYFLPFHLPLFIPWDDVTYARRYLFFATEVTLIINAHPDIPIHIDNRLANNIQDAIGKRWFEGE